jgi:biopolymer transport protein ExbB
MAERGISDIAMVSKGVAFALRATALGIVVALFSLAYYYVLNALVKKHSILK